MVPRKGAEVAEITEKSLKDVLEIRRALEDLAVRLACEKITKEDLKELKKAGDEFKKVLKSQDITEVAEADVRFHDVIYMATDNPKLIQLLNNFREQMYRYRYEYIKDASQHQRLIEEHRVIYESIVKKDRETAGQAARMHIDNQEKAIMQQLRAEKQRKL